MDVTLNFGSPVTRPRLGSVLIVFRAPVAIPDRQQELLAVCAQIAEVCDRSIRPPLQTLHAVHLAHPGLFIWNHRAATQKLSHLRSAEEPLHHQHLNPRGPRQVAKLVMSALREYQVYFAQ